MCDFPGKLVAWLDGELPEGEAVEVQRHVESCVECRGRIDTVERVSKGVNAYCDEALRTKVHHGAVRWGLVLSAAAVVGIAVFASFADFAHKSASRYAGAETPTAARSSDTTESAAPPFVATDAAHAPKKENHREVPRQSRRVSLPAQVQSANWGSAEPAVQIAIPAEAMFPPGAVPDGIHFVAEMSIAPDGSAEGLRLQPRLVGFERRATQP